MIYESPDGGKTVYAREPLSGNRKMVKVSDDTEGTTWWYLWREILIASKDNPALANAIAVAETIYGITK